MTTLSQRMKEARSDAGLSQAALAKLVGSGQSTIASIENGRNQSAGNLVQIALALGVSPTWLAEGKGPKKPLPVKLKEVHSAEETDEPTGAIPYWDARGSCGGGFLNYEQLPVGHLIKEASFFKKYQVRPEHAIAVYADGDSMSDYIVDGDIVIFDTSKTTPRSGKIFLIDHPDGLRIKQLRREIDGAWILESRNVDKRKFPDERLTPDQVDFLKIQGEFVYRQGG
ncbi:XRE family transcriptional regulator [Achromobacter aegrifaciens]|uniref:XRE family transcriptional regulator n=1 Tax=Achromobacter aegrifaciens TaxID=1287736 RepID=UPI0032092BCB